MTTQTKEKKPLSDARASSVKAPGAYADGTVRGLFLIVTAKGSKVWRLRYWVDKKEYVFSLGRFEHVGVKQARQAAEAAKELVSRGIHPKDAKQADVTARKAQQAQVFDAVAEEFIQHMKAKDDWSASTEAGVRISLNANISPIMGTVPVGDVDVGHVKTVLNQPRLVGKRAAQKTAFSVMKRVLGFALVSRYVAENVTLGLEVLLPKPKKGEPVHKHHPAITKPEPLRAYLHRLDANPTRSSSFYGLRLLTMLPVRPVELAKMRWADLDLEAGLWTYVMSKVNREHVVPLPRQALTILRELQARRMGQCEYVLPGRLGADRHVNPESFRLALVEQLGYAVGEVTPHGFRSTFRTLARKPLGIDTTVLELSIGHETPEFLGDTYDKNIFLDERIAAAQKYADWLDELRSRPA